jgi:hypothetical protein
MPVRGQKLDGDSRVIPMESRKAWSQHDVGD